jgi:hypothetical protein
MMPTVIFGCFFTDNIILVLRPFFKTFSQASHPSLSSAERKKGETRHWVCVGGFCKPEGEGKKTNIAKDEKTSKRFQRNS